MIYVVGFLAQLFFSARILLQWILSERAKKVISPTIFWQLSLVGSYLLFLYGIRKRSSTGNVFPELCVLFFC